MLANRRQKKDGRNVPALQRYNLLDTRGQPNPNRCHRPNVNDVYQRQERGWEKGEQRKDPPPAPQLVGATPPTKLGLVRHNQTRLMLSPLKQYYFDWEGFRWRTIEMKKRSHGSTEQIVQFLSVTRTKVSTRYHGLLREIMHVMITISFPSTSEQKNRPH